MNAINVLVILRDLYRVRKSEINRVLAHIEYSWRDYMETKLVVQFIVEASTEWK